MSAKTKRTRHSGESRNLRAVGAKFLAARRRSVPAKSKEKARPIPAKAGISAAAKRREIVPPSATVCAFGEEIPAFAGMGRGRDGNRGNGGIRPGGEAWNPLAAAERKNSPTHRKFGQKNHSVRIFLHRGEKKWFFSGDSVLKFQNRP
ncbi:MAG: hypothetical protein ACR2QC_02950 [Gammaproteobacteria bacterium]